MTSSVCGAARSGAGILRRLRGDQGGAIAPMFAGVISVLVLLLATVVELGRWAIAKNELQAALDSAVLAGAAQLQSNQADKAAAIALAQKMFAANRISRKFGSEVTDSVQFTVDGSSLVATGTSDITTALAKVVGVTTLPLLGTSGATGGSTSQTGSKATITNSYFEIAVMLDITGSMCDDPPDTVSDAPCTSGTKLNGMKAAATSLVNSMLSSDDLKKRVRISLVPFSDGVRLPKDILGLPLIQTAAAGISPGVQTFADPQTQTTCTGSGSRRVCNTSTYYDYYYYHPTECVAERIGSDKYTDAAPGLNNYVSYAMQRRNGSASNSTALEMGCSLGTASTLTPLTNNKDALLTKISGLAAKGGTAGHLGTAWAWYTLSPNWKDVFPGTDNDPAAYTAKTDKTLRKIAILMTDGEYNNQFTIRDTSGCVGRCGYKNGTWAYTSASNAASSTQALALCGAMKGEPSNIEVYTIGFAVNSTSDTMLKTCATDSAHYFKAETADQLVQVFESIGQRVLALYLSE